MSRIQTPTVTVNPNVELANREAPTIIYQPEPYVPETYFDYEQLSNVLGAGVQAAQTFLETSLLDRRRQAEIAAEAAKERSDRFRVGLSEAILQDKQAQVGEKLESRHVRDFLARTDYESLDPADQELYNRTLGERSEAELDQQRKFNSDLITGRIKSSFEQVKGQAMKGDPNAINVLANIRSEDGALSFLTGLVDPREIAVIKQVSSYDETIYRNKFSTLLADVMGEAGKYRTELKRTEAKLKIDAMGEWTANGFADQVMNPKADLSKPENFSVLQADLESNLRNIRAVVRTVDPTKSDQEIDLIQDQIVAMISDRIVTEGSPEETLAFRNMMKTGTGYVIDPAKRGDLVNKLDEQVKIKYTERVNNNINLVSNKQLETIQIDARKANPALKSQQLAEFAEFVQKNMSISTGIGDEKIDIMSATDVTERISKHKSAMERIDETFIEPRVVDATQGQLQKALQGDITKIRADTLMDGIRRAAADLGVIQGTPEYNNMSRELSREIDTRFIRDLTNKSLATMSNRYGRPITSLDPNDADNASVDPSGGNPAIRAQLNADKAQLRIQAKTLHLRLALMMKDSMGNTYSDAVSNFRSGLVGLIGPNLEGPIPVELFDAVAIARDETMRREVFGEGSENGDKLLRFLDEVNVLRNAATGRPLDELIRSAALKVSLTDPRAGWVQIEKDKEWQFHKDTIDDLVGDVMPDSTVWFRNVYAGEFFTKMRDTNDSRRARSLAEESLGQVVMSVGRSVLPRQDIGAKGEQHVLDMAQVLTGRKDTTFIVAGNDEMGNFLYALRDQDGEQVILRDSNGKPLPTKLYTMGVVPVGVTNRESLTDPEFVRKVEMLNIQRGDKSIFDRAAELMFGETYKKPAKQPEPSFFMPMVIR